MNEQARVGELTRKQKLFIAIYLKTKNGTQSAIQAGYSERSAASIAYTLLNNPIIKAEIERRIEATIDRYEISADNIARELASLAFSSVGDLIAIQDDGSAIVDLSTATKRQLAALAGIEVEEYIDGRGESAQRVKRVKLKHSMADKRQALMDLAKLRSYLPNERTDVNVSGSIDHNVRPEHKIDIEAMDHDKRDQLKQLLLAAVKRGPVTDVEDDS